MGARGPAPKPRLQVVREGNPGRKSKAKLDAQVAPCFLRELIVDRGQRVAVAAHHGERTGLPRSKSSAARTAGALTLG